MVTWSQKQNSSNERGPEVGEWMQETKIAALFEFKKQIEISSLQVGSCD